MRANRMSKASPLNTATSALGKLRTQWLAANPYKEFLPQNLNQPARQVTKLKGAEFERVADLGSAVDGKLNQSDDSNRSKQRTTYKQRRQIEAKLADYIEGHMPVFQHVRELRDAPEKMRACRRAGYWGERITGDRRKLVMVWDYKCGIGRLCPDESRAEQRRLVKRYKPAAMDWVRQKPGMRRIQKGVVTWPNVAPGQLALMKRRMCKELAAFIKKFPTIKGALVSQEDPLSERGDWNLHLNVIFLVEGRLDWLALIERWTEQTRHLFPECDAEHFQIKMRPLDRTDDKELDAALRECIKYAVKHQDMTTLDPYRFLEWFNAGLRFRRTRSYGVLFRIAKPQREYSETVFYGRVMWEGSLRNGVYAVHRAVFSTQANNSRGRAAENNSFRGSGPPRAAPPPARSGPVVLRGGF